MPKRNLQAEMLGAVGADDRAKGHRLLAEMHEEAARNYAKEVELINDTFYRMWQDWTSLDIAKVHREES